MKTLVIIPRENACAAALVSRTFYACGKRSADMLEDCDISDEERLFGSYDRVINFLGEKILKHPPQNSVNIHPAIPAFPGRGVAARTLYELILSGGSAQPLIGATVHRMTERPDEGEILNVLYTDQEDVPLRAKVIWHTQIICALVALEWLVDKDDFTKLPVVEGVSWRGKAWTQKEFRDWANLKDFDWTMRCADELAAVRIMACAWTGKPSAPMEALKKSVGVL